MEVTIILLFEANTEDLAVEFATRSCLTDDWTKARDEQYLDVAHLLRNFHFGSGSFRFEDGFPNLRAESRNRLRCAPWAERRGNGRRGSAPAGSQVVRMSGLQARPLGDGTSVGTLAHSSREVQPETNGRTSPVCG